MSETEFENDSNVAVAEPPPAEKTDKPEKPVRKTTRKPKAENGSTAGPQVEEVPGPQSMPEPTSPS